MREAASPDRLMSFYKDFTALLDRGINPFTMEGNDGYFYLKAMYPPINDGTLHPDLFSVIQMNIYANKNGKAYLTAEMLRNIDPFSIEDPLLTKRNLFTDDEYNCPSYALPFRISAAYLESLYWECRANLEQKMLPAERYPELSKEYAGVLDKNLLVTTEDEYYDKFIPLQSGKNMPEAEERPKAGSEAALCEKEATLNFNIALLTSDLTLKNLNPDFSSFAESEEEAERLRQLTVVILAFSLINDSLYFQEKPIPVVLALSGYRHLLPEALRPAEQLRTIFTDDFDFSSWYQLLHQAQLFTHLSDRDSDQHIRREGIIEQIGQIHYTDKRDIVFESSPPKWYCNDIPMISILNSFLPELRDGTVMSIADADKCFKSIHEHMNKTNVENRTDARITFSVSYARGSIKETATIPENYAMDLCREARIPQHIAHLASLGVIEDPGLPAFLSKHLGLSLIEEKVAKEVIPSIEKEAERKDYTSYIRTYIKSSRRLLNQHHDIDIAAPLGVRNYRTDKSMRTTRREKKEAAATDDESKSKRRENTRTRTRQDKRKRRLR